MKLLAIVAIVLVSTVAAQNEHNETRVLLEGMLLRADNLVAKIKEIIVQHKDLHEHLLHALREQEKKIISMAEHLRKTLDDHSHNPRQSHHIHTLEEQLFYIENRVAEEIYAIEHAKDPNHHKNHDEKMLIEQAEKLVKDGKEAIRQYPHAKEVDDINSEIIVIEALIATIKSKPNDLKKYEEELLRHEQTIKQLIVRAERHH
ncbi:hypothetical protein RDWZM_000347 [Blomia tropicalis]|uniref:Blo t 5 allergen n=1 Tax=Blomia tropicalis TaxID=40697 RepID=A0A9Q0MC80_BLOTA|nr:hypothetical protein RDWZM_000347 [Blomia tropicalis]